jgi:hypothetical protein
MTAELATTTGSGLARALPGIMPDVTSEALDRLARWVDAASNAHKLVAPLIGTPWVPAAYQPWGGKPPPNPTLEERARAYEVATASGTAAVLYGSTLGVDPLMALQQIYVINGRPALYAKMMVALVQSHGHEVWDEDLTDTRAVVCGRRKGSSHVARITITMDMARKAGWTRNQKYSESPQDMLWARAASRVCDRIASDVLKGIPSVEEAQDDEAVHATATAGPAVRTVAPRKRVAAPAVTAAVEEPDLDEPEPGPVELGDADTIPCATPEQWSTFLDALRKTGRATEKRVHETTKRLLGREVTNPQDMTTEEAQLLVDALSSELPSDPDGPPLEDMP